MWAVVLLRGLYLKPTKKNVPFFALRSVLIVKRSSYNIALLILLNFIMAAAANDPGHVLKGSKKILLIDWPNVDVPRALLQAGFTVFCYSPNGYTQAEQAAEFPQNVNPKNIFPPKTRNDGYLVFRPLTAAPAAVDIVNVYRPEAEHAKIMTDVVLPLKAKCVWLQPPLTSDDTRVIAESQGLIFIQGSDIATIAVQLNSQG